MVAGLWALSELWGTGNRFTECSWAIFCSIKNHVCLWAWQLNWIITTLIVLGEVCVCRATSQDSHESATNILSHIPSEEESVPSVEAHVCNPSYSGGGHKRVADQGHPSKSKRSYLKNRLKAKRWGGMGQVVEHEALSSIPVPQKKLNKVLDRW
jgi:hypothetical protein